MTSKLKVDEIVNSTDTGSPSFPYGVTFAGTASAINISYSGALTGGTGVVNIGSGQFYKDASGNLGIGTSSPGNKLDVNGRGRFVQDAAATTGAIVLRQNSGDTVGAHIQWVTNDNLSQKGYMLVDTSSNMVFATGTTERMRIDASGNVGIGTSSPSSFAGYTTLTLNNATNGGNLVLQTNGTTVGSMYAANSVLSIYSNTGVPIVLQAGGAERMRITSDGNLLVGVSSTPDNANFVVESSRVSAWKAIVSDASSSGTALGVLSRFVARAPNDASSIFFYGGDNAGAKFVAFANGGIANYSANNVNLSDRREKTNFAPARNYLDVICAIPVQTFNYIDQNREADDGRTLGVVAQDVQAVAPELVTESNWGTAEEPKMRLSIYQTDLQYALMKCIQEQQAMINELRKEIAALKGA